MHISVIPTQVEMTDLPVSVVFENKKTKHMDSPLRETDDGVLQ